MIILDLINTAITQLFLEAFDHLIASKISPETLKYYGFAVGFMSFKRMGKGAAAGGYYFASAWMKNTARGVDDYYTQAAGHEPVGSFFDPSGALEAFNIHDNQNVTTEAFQRLLAGRDPLNGEPLIKIVDDKHVAGFDCTMSVPKNVSALWAVSTGDQRASLEMIMAHANTVAMKFLSDKAGITRRGKGGTIDEHVDLISAAWRHSSSREADPQRHFHNTVFDIAKRADGTWGTIESKHLMQWQTAAGAVFRAALAEGLQQEFAGINITNNEKTRSFDIDGMPEELLKFWSKRTNEINDLAKESGATSHKQIDVIKLESRKDKSFGESVEDMQARWKSEADALSFTTEAMNDVLTQTPKEAMDPELFKRMMDAVPGELIEMDSVFTEQELFRKVAELSAGVQGLDGIQATVDSLLERTLVDEIEIKEVINIKEMDDDATIRVGIESRIRAGIDTRFSSRVDGGRSGADGRSRLGGPGRRSDNGLDGARGPGAIRSNAAAALSNHQPGIAAIVADRARRGFGNGVRALSESSLARHGSSKNSRVLRNNAQHNRRTINNLRRNVSHKPTVRGEVIAQQADPQAVVIAIGVDKEGRNVYTTLKQIQVEQDLKKRAGKMANDGAHNLDSKIIEKAIANRKTMSDEQADAVRHAFSPGSLKVIEGAAGAGKSYSLDAVREAFESQGYKMQGIALSWQAAKVLQESASIDSRAITGFLADVESGKVKLDAKTVLVCDENGLVGSVYGQKILKYAAEAGAKVIITGDEEQLNPVQAGPAMKIMKMEAGSIKISEIRRQKELWQREMVFNFSKGNSRDALNALDSRGKLHLLAGKKSTIDRVAADFYNFLNNNRDKSALALGGSNEDTKNLNLAIRELKRADGLIGNADKILKTEFGDLPFTPGDKMMFRKNDKTMDVINRATGTLLSIDTFKNGYQMHVRLDDGRDVTVDSRKYKGEDGFLPMHHGDAMTVYSSQGMTVDQSFVMHSASMDRRLAYVGYSRHREDTQIYVDKAAAVGKMQSNLAADEYEGFKPADADIKEAVARQYHSQSQKISTLDYLTDAQAQKIIDAHIPKPEFTHDLSAVVKANDGWLESLNAGWHNLEVQEHHELVETTPKKLTENFHKALIEGSNPRNLGVVGDVRDGNILIVESYADYQAIIEHQKRDIPTIIVAGALGGGTDVAAFSDEEIALLGNAHTICVAGRNDLSDLSGKKYDKAVEERAEQALRHAPNLSKNDVRYEWPDDGDERLHESIKRAAEAARI